MERRPWFSQKWKSHLNWQEGRWLLTSRQNEHTAWGMSASPGSGRATHQAVTQEISAPSEGKYTRTSPAWHQRAELLLNTTEETNHWTVSRFQFL